MKRSIRLLCTVIGIGGMLWIGIDNVQAAGHKPGTREHFRRLGKGEMYHSAESNRQLDVISKPGTITFPKRTATQRKVIQETIRMKATGRWSKPGTGGHFQLLKRGLGRMSHFSGPEQILNKMCKPGTMAHFEKLREE